MLGSIEAGGTKFVCAVSDMDLNVIDKITIDTDTPNQTLPNVYNFFHRYKIKSIGLGCFGPVNINMNSKKYGYITSTPKLAWKDFNILKAIKENISPNVALNTDVNVAAYAESICGAAIGKNNCIYITVGTGIGGGIVINNKIINTHHHPELGHIFIKKAEHDNYIGNCPYHKDCLEGLASGPAINDRWKTKPITIPRGHEAWDLEAFYLAQAVINYTLTFAPDIIILGGGVMNNPELLSKIRSSVLLLLNGYFPLKNLDEYLVPPKLGNSAGIMGGLLITKDLYDSLQK